MIFLSAQLNLFDKWDKCLAKESNGFRERECFDILAIKNPAEFVPLKYINL